MRKLRVLDLFSGIGGFSLGLERTGGFTTVAFCEIEDFPRRVLTKHWPNVPIYDDVRNLDGETLFAHGIEVDVITAGFPCQDVSLANRRGRDGIADGTRSGLYSEVIRITGEVRPEYVLMENVTNLLAGPSEQRGAWFGRILGDLAEIGYDAEWHCIPASYLGAWHRRDRVWILAHPNASGQQGRTQEEMVGQSRISWSSEGSFARWPGRSGLSQPKTVRRTDGVPKRLDALGNAVVPQIPEMIGHAILETYR